jgi:signal transduction histidine kinase
LCQQIAATGMLTATLVKRLRGQDSPLAEIAGRIVTTLSRAGDDAHAMARGLLPVQVEADGLMVALAALARRTQEMQGVACDFECAAPVPVQSNTIATYLFRIAQEAIHNAIKHGKARHIVVTLTGQAGVTLTVFDDGVGIPPEARRAGGSGLRIMAYRARVIGATLSVEPIASGGTRIRCALIEGVKQP